MDHMKERYNQLSDKPFNSKDKFAFTYIESSSKKSDLESVIIVKGAPDILLSRCASYFSGVGESEKPLDEEAKLGLMATQEEWSRKGERVILITRRAYPSIHPHGSIEFEEELCDAALGELTVVGLIGILDPPREDIPSTVSELRRCGSRVFMVTGDFRLTACAIAHWIPRTSFLRGFGWSLPSDAARGLLGRTTIRYPCWNSF
jgi:sodium/potassium-transporting ATPase subunit alpha